MAPGRDRLQAEVDRYLGFVTGDQHVAGMAWISDWGSLRYAAAASFSAALLYDLTGDGKYRDFVLGQLDYILGDNEYGRSFIVGIGSNYPLRPHHRNAYGHDLGDFDDATDFAADPKFLLRGALVGGPTKGDMGPTTSGYEDEITDYVGNEVALDYNAVAVGIAAFAVVERSK